MGYFRAYVCYLNVMLQNKPNGPLEIIRQPFGGICRLNKKQTMSKRCLIIKKMSLNGNGKQFVGKHYNPFLFCSSELSGPCLYKDSLAKTST